MPNLLQCVRTDTYFAWAKVDGKTIRLGLDTDVVSTAKLRLPDKLKIIRKPAPVWVEKICTARQFQQTNYAWRVPSNYRLSEKANRARPL